MKIASLVISIICLIVLSSILIMQAPILLSSQKQLYNLEENTLIEVKGTIINQYSYGSSYVITLDNNISCIVDSVLKLKTKVIIKGIVDKYENNIRINALEVETYDH